MSQLNTTRLGGSQASTRPSALAAVDAPVGDVAADLRFEHGLGDRCAEQVVLRRLEVRHRPLSRLELVDVNRAESRARSLLGEEGFQAAHRAGATDPHPVVDRLESSLAKR